MNAKPPLTRRGWLAAIGGFAGVGVAAGAAAKLLVGPALGTALAPIVIPPGTPQLIGARLTNLHARYSKTLATQGAAALRGQVISELRGFRGAASWQESIVEWIGLAGWQDCADILVDAAEIGETDLRRSCAATLVGRKTPLLKANGYGPRIIALQQSEVDPLARQYWTDLRGILGI